MSLIRLDSIEKSFAGKEVLCDIDFRVEEGEHIGLIGRNGTGKSTIFRLITGEMDPERGTVDRMKRVRIACLSQIHDVEDNKSIYDIVMGSFFEII
ncbi:MAG: ATP-binding cassette domain-containing protein, partial [Candidatus Hydrogenedentes bacterium]|nr:ATP-binding cassette domain-containing protein [Candidatus Hydrogenedentota bacterium]